MKKMIRIGHTKGPHGVKGAVKCKIEDNYMEDFLALERVYLEIGGTRLPYAVRKIQPGNETILILDGLNTREDAQRMTSKSLFMTEDDLIPDEDRLFKPYVSPYADFVGFTITDTEEGVIGIVQEVREMPGQDMAILHIEGREVMIPLAGPLIIQVDKPHKNVLMDLPLGLLD